MMMIMIFIYLLLLLLSLLLLLLSTSICVYNQHFIALRFSAFKLYMYMRRMAHFVADLFEGHTISHPQIVMMSFIKLH